MNKTADDSVFPAGHFSRMAGSVLQSPYFLDPPPGKNAAEDIALSEQRHTERERLEDALRKVTSFADLDDEFKELFTKAARAIGDRVSEDDITDRLVGDQFDYEISEEAMRAAGPSADESQALTLAILAAAAAGKHDQAEEMAVLGKTPGLVAEIARTHKPKKATAKPPAKPTGTKMTASPFTKRLPRRKK